MLLRSSGLLATLHGFASAESVVQSLGPQCAFETYSIKQKIQGVADTRYKYVGIDHCVHGTTFANVHGDRQTTLIFDLF
jgi:hypothetical protein